MECVAAILIRTTATTHKHYLNEPVYQHMISPLHLLMTGDLSTQKRKEQCPESDDGNAPVRSVLCVQEFFFFSTFLAFHLTEHPLMTFCSLSVLDLVYCYPEQTEYYRDARNYKHASAPYPVVFTPASVISATTVLPSCFKAFRHLFFSKTLCQWSVVFVRFGSFGWSDLTPSNASPLFCRTCKSSRGEGMKGSVRNQKDWEIRPEKIMRGGYVHC